MILININEKEYERMTDGQVTPIEIGALPYRSENASSSHEKGEYREWYKTEQGNCVVTRDRAYDDQIIEWKILE
jgi:hypothetical protein